MYKVYCHQYNEDSHSRGDYYTHRIATCATKELAEKIAKYEHDLDTYYENYFKYDSGYESVYYTIEEAIPEVVLTSIEEYYQSKEM